MGNSILILLTCMGNSIRMKSTKRALGSFISVKKNDSQFKIFVNHMTILTWILNFNPFMLNAFIHPYQLDGSISNFRFLGGIFHFYSNFKRNLCKQIDENLIRRHILRCLIWFCTICQCPTKNDARLIWVKTLYIPMDYPIYISIISMDLSIL